MSNNLSNGAADPNRLPDTRYQADHHPPDLMAEPEESAESSLEDQAQHQTDDRATLKRLLISLIGLGLALGTVLAIGVVWLMNQLDLIDPTSPPPPSSTSQVSDLAPPLVNLVD